MSGMRSRVAGAATFVISLCFAISATPAINGSADGLPSTGGDGGYSFHDSALPGTGGSEPSIFVDTGATASKNYMYVTRIGGSPALWHSYDLGQTWSAQVPYHAAANGCQPSAFGDEDVTVLPNGNVLVGHLNVTTNDVQVSTDHGLTFGTCAGVGPESDREWFGSNGNNLVYLAYHDFVAEVPFLCTSVNGGVAFLPCTQTFSNLTAANCAENTVMARPVAIDPTDGSINIPYSCSTAPENFAQPPFGPLHDYKLARGVPVGTTGVPATFATTDVFTADQTGGKKPNFGNIFSTLRIDPGGTMYLVMSGTADDNHVLSNPYHIYLTISKDHGATWSTLRQIDSEADGKGTHVFPDMWVTASGQLDIIWLSAVDPTSGADVTGEPNGQCGSTTAVTNCMDGAQNVGMAPGGPIAANWQLYMAQSLNALSATPQFDITQMSPGAMHSGEICTNGIVCGSSDRSLSDYISIGVDCNGNAHATYADNFGHALQTHVADQVGGTALAPPATCPAAVIIPEVPVTPLLPLAALAAFAVATLRRQRGTRMRAA